MLSETAFAALIQEQGGTVRIKKSTVERLLGNDWVITRDFDVAAQEFEFTVTRQDNGVHPDQQPLNLPDVNTGD